MTQTGPGTGAARALSPARRAAPRIRLGIRTRRALVVAHILAAAAWIGIDVMVAVLVTTGWMSDDASTKGLAYQALGRFAVTPMLASALLCAATGLLLGLATKWGLARYWWVLAKLVVTVVLCTLIVLALRPGMDEVTTAGASIAEGRAPSGDLTSLFFPPAVSLAALSCAVTLSVVKPWGRIRGRATPRIRAWEDDRA